jgi:SAM-dependent methyltransferase
MDCEDLTHSHGSSEVLPFTGERFTPQCEGTIAFEHWHRYLLAKPLVAGHRVLDIASGEGYGSYLLSEGAASVCGVDISGETIAHAQRTYSRANLEFKQGSCAQIPLPNASIDVVVSFETIEHHDQHEEMMKEIKRVLRPGGLLIISSPDKAHYSKSIGENNHYHIKELFKEELAGLLSRYFKHFRLLGQKVIFGSGVFAMDPSRHLSLKMPASIGSAAEVTLGLRDPLYWIAICSDGDLPIVESSLLEDDVLNSDQVRSQTARAETLQNEVRILNARLEELKSQMDELKKSSSWRLTAPIRYIGDLLGK